MELLKQRIRRDGQVRGEDILKVDMFLNHQIDVALLNEIGKEFARIFAGRRIDKIVTIEASGIGIACIAAQYFDVPVVFAKKGKHRNVGEDIYLSDVFSFTKGETYQIGISRAYLSAGEHALVLDDFLANGQAILGLKQILDQAGAVLEGVGIVIEKGFQPGGKELRAAGLDVRSLAIVESMRDGVITFRDGNC